MGAIILVIAIAVVIVCLARKRGARLLFGCMQTFELAWVLFIEHAKLIENWVFSMERMMSDDLMSNIIIMHPCIQTDQQIFEYNWV